MKRIVSYTATLVLLQTLTLSAHNASASDGLDAAPVPENRVLQPFRSVYKLTFWGFSGDGTIELRKGELPDHYVFTSISQARGLAKLVRANPATETTHFHVSGNELLTDEYFMDAGNGEKLENSYARFDWEKMIAYSNHQEERVDVPLSEGVLDRMSADLKVTLDQQDGVKPGDYRMVHRNHVKTYKFTYQGVEKVKTPMGTFDTIKYLRQREGSSRAATIWYAPELDYQPVKVVQTKKGRKGGTLILQSYTTNL